MSEQHKIELAFSRSRFAIIIATAVVTGLGLLAAGLFAGIEVGSVQARAASPSGQPSVRVPANPGLPETLSPLPLQYSHELPVIGPVASLVGAFATQATTTDGSDPTADTNVVARQQQYVVQAASFRDRGEAERLTEDLVHRGYAAGILDFKDQAGRSWLMVRVGPYGARAEASQAASELGHLTRTEPIVRAVEN